MRAAALLFVGAAAVGCTWNSAALYSAPARAPLKLQVTTVPPPDAGGLITRSATIVVQLDDYPDPDSAIFGPIQLRSGSATFDISVSVDLVGRAIVITPRSLLSPNNQYQVIVEAGLRALDGRTVAATVSQTLKVGLDQGTPPVPPVVPTWNGDIKGDIATCAPSCHSPIGASGRARTPTRMLDLTGDPNDPTFGLINVEAQGELDFPEPLLRVAPGDSAHSVLLRKLIGGDPLADSHDPPYPAMGVDGRRMPISLDETMSVPPLDIATLRRLQTWIDGGAPID